MISTLEQIFGFIASNATTITAIIAVCVFAKSIYEYTLQNKLKRFEKYQDIAGQWDENKDLQEIRRLLDFENKSALAKADPEKKQNFIHCYEDIAVMCESGLLNEKMAFYMFGFYAIRSLQSKEFWTGLNEGDFYYTLFRRFATRMEVIEKRINDRLDDPRRWRFKF